MVCIHKSIEITTFIALNFLFLKLDIYSFIIILLDIYSFVILNYSFLFSGQAIFTLSLIVLLAKITSKIASTLILILFLILSY